MDSLIYLICFGVGLLFTIVSAVAAHLFGGHDAQAEGGTGGHAEAGFGADNMPGFAALSPTTIACFVTAFGGLGMVFSRVEATANPWVSAPLSLLGAFGIAASVVCLFRSVFRKTQGSSESRVATLIGHEATVITPIPENGVGEIAYVQSGSRYSAPAREEHGRAVNNGQAVTIVRIAGTQFYVVPIEPTF